MENCATPGPIVDKNPVIIVNDPALSRVERNKNISLLFPSIPTRNYREKLCSLQVETLSQVLS